MNRLGLFKWLTAIGATAIVVACADTAAPAGGGGGGALPNIVALPVAHPALCADTAAFYAVKGDDRVGELTFDRGNCPHGEKYAELKVDGQALFRRPDGSVFVTGDSIQIRFWVVSPDSMLFQFEPAGLQFDPHHPARLHIEYGEENDDFDHDGHVTHADSTIKDSLAVWHQDSVGGAFTKLQTDNFEDANEIESDVLGFSRYAIAY